MSETVTAFQGEVAILRIPGPEGATHQWRGPLWTIAEGLEYRRLTIPVRMSKDREQIHNMAFMYCGYLQMQHPSLEWALYLYRPVITPGTILAHRLVQQLARNKHWHRVDSRQFYHHAVSASSFMM